MYRWTSSLVPDYYPTVDHERDYIAGSVGEIIDGNSFELYVSEEDPDNLHSYQLIEIVNVFGKNAPPLDTPEGIEAMEALAEELEDQDVVCEVLGRDQAGNLIAIYNID